MAQEQEQERGNFSLDTYHFSYAFDREHAHLVLLDQTGSIATQRNILLILFGVTILSLLLLFGLSTLFATRTVRPVKEAFDRQNFVADASHELKTPLAILNANLSVLAENGTESVASQDQWISAMQVQITRMNGLINDMLTLAKLDHDQDAIPTRAVDFSRLTTGCLLSFEAVAYEKGVEIRSRISEHLMVNGSPERFSRLVDILLDNAVKHTPSGGIVEVVLSREKNHAVLSVRNSGKRFPPMRSPRIRPVLPGGQRTFPRNRRLWSWPCHRQIHCGKCTRKDFCGECRQSYDLFRRTPHLCRGSPRQWRRCIRAPPLYYFHIGMVSSQEPLRDLFVP